MIETCETVSAKLQIGSDGVKQTNNVLVSVSLFIFDFVAITSKDPS